ncbi:MAG TPA: hypothetical protein VLH35_04730 [Candidatus Acidoferrales bacterium]|nr:hypothetical protein [Candidatus Acidoferrales bacterium]
MQITVEYMIMIPVMILQIFLFPFVATLIMDNWNDSRQTLELHETAGHLSSTIQQMYYTINRASVSSGSASMKINIDIPRTIENHAYTVTLQNVTGLDSAYRVMNITLRFISFDGSTSTLVTLGDNINWADNLAFNSVNTGLCLTATKTADTIILTLEDEA